MSDKEYLYAFMKLTQAEKDSLMVSEVERRRTFVAHWPIESISTGDDCAREGFYYTGMSDKVQCVVCGGILKNWEKGDTPRLLHKKYFNFCKIVQGQTHNFSFSVKALRVNCVWSRRCWSSFHFLFYF